MMTKPKVSIIIVNWNGGKVFEECLGSLEKLKYSNYELIIVDNGSMDGTQKFATIRNKKNLGFVGANNQAIKIVKGKYVLLLNNDTKVPPELLDVLVAKMESDSKIGVVQPKIFMMDNSGYLDNAGSFITKIGFFRHWGFQKKDSKEFDREKEIFAAKGACMIIRKDLIDKVGLFDEDYFAYFEESDFCWRVWLNGYKILYYPKTFIYHKVGFTIKRQNVSELNYHYYKNRIASLIKNLNNWNVLWIVPLHVILSFGIAFVFLVRGSIKNPLIILRAIWWNIVNISKTLKKRSRVQNSRTTSDKYIFKNVGQKVDFLKFFGDFKRVEKDLQSTS